MFVHNKYYSWYIQLTSTAKQRNWNRTTANCYVEQHHIIPKSVDPLLINDPNNLVYLTAREHFIAHLLLVKCTYGVAKIKMQYAISCMINLKTNDMRRYTPSSKLYEFAKQQRSIVMSAKPGSNLGKTFSDDTKLKMSSAKLGRKFTSQHKANMLAAQVAARQPKPACCIKCQREFTSNPTRHFNICHRD